MSFWSILETIFIGPLKLVFEYIFYFAHAVVQHPGLAIVALSLAMNILVLPLYRRADAMQEAARDVENKLARGVAHIKKAFSGDERMMILQTYYRQNHYKPTDALKGSVSLLLEVPFFMAAYQFLSSLSVLEHSSFGPIADLSLPDGLIVLGGLTINALPVLMTLINVISSAIYLKGFPLKTKIQLYGMALFFLMFLYNSPAGLVFYWTLNNLFSLVKTIFYKLKNPKRVGLILLLVSGAAISIYGLFFYDTVSIRRKLFVLIIGIAAMLIPVAVRLLRRLPAPETAVKTNRKLFLLAGLFLTALIGLLIPSAVISASPQEFVNTTQFYHPLFYVLYTACMAAGTFLVWLQVFYWLANDTGRVIFERLIWVMCGAMLVTYLFFGTKLGVLSPTLKYELDLVFSRNEQLLNLIVLAITAAALLLILWKWQKPSISVLAIASIAIIGMSSVNMVSVDKAVQRFADGDVITSDSSEIQFTLSQSGENVVVIMLDRALGEVIPYILQEKPELKEQFDGFTYYSNTISFGSHTNLGLPALLGGYEYTPVEMNRRNDKLLVEKHNEALKLMPTLFSQNGYETTVFDPSYANYNWIPDLSIYQNMPNVSAYITEGKFSPAQDRETQIRSLSRNFFCFSLMKTLPLPLQSVVYGFGNYNQMGSQLVQTATEVSVAHGSNGEFLDAFYVLRHMNDITKISANDEDTFLLMFNNATHEPALLQAPDYLPADSVYNVDYDASHAYRFEGNDGAEKFSTVHAMGHYHVNMATLLQLGRWFDYLRENGVYDNTRIILAADHGTSLDQKKQNNEDAFDSAKYYPLLLVKDFGAEGFVISEEFMTNADVPSLAMNGVIDNLVNPFTGNAINMAEKNAHPQYISLSTDWDPMTNNGNAFLPSKWASVQSDRSDPDNWQISEDSFVLDEHKLP